MTNTGWTPKEEINPETRGISSWPSQDIIRYRIKETRRTADALELALMELTKAAEVVTRCAESTKGRIITIGAGGSGVIAMSIMRELPQNHKDIDPNRFTYRIAGQEEILTPYGREELEDSWEEGRNDVEKLQVCRDDVIICVSATGRTPYTRAAARASRATGAFVIGIVCRSKTELASEVDLPIVLEVGPEMFFGATCEKAATAQKVALAAIMDAVVVRMGITLDNVCQAREVHEKARIRKQFYEQELAASQGRRK